MNARFPASACVGLALLAPASAVSQTATRYCVEDVVIDKIEAPPPFYQSGGPSKLRFGFEALSPFAEDFVRDPPDASDRYFLRRAHWRIEPDFRVRGPYDIARLDPIGHDGTIAYFIEHANVWGRAETEDQPKEDRIWSLAPSGQATLVEGPWSGEGWDLSAFSTSPKVGGARPERLGQQRKPSGSSGILRPQKR